MGASKFCTARESSCLVGHGGEKSANNVSDRRKYLVADARALGGRLAKKRDRQVLRNLYLTSFTLSAMVGS